MKRKKEQTVMPPIIQRVACYCRVSTENQIENYSIEEQKERLEAFCKARGWKNPAMYIDPGFSGGNLERPAIRELIGKVEAGKIDVVCVYKLDRLSRSQKDTLYLIEDVFEKNNVSFVSVCENFDTSTPLGKAMIGIISVFAQLEKDQIKERFTMGRIGRAKSGLYHGNGTPPMGYDYVDGKLVINEYQAMLVKEVYENFLHGKSISGITAYMNNKYGWGSDTAVHNVLKNSVYIGKVKFSGVEYNGIHEPIIAQKTYYETQRLLSERSEKIPEPQKYPFRAGYLLTGLIYCGNCGARYTGIASRGIYSCYSRNKKCRSYITDPNCKNPNMKIEELDNFIFGEIAKAAVDPSKILQDYAPKENDNRRELLENRLAEIKKQSKKVLDLLDKMSVDAIAEKLQVLESERIIVSKQLDELPPIEINRRQEWLDLLANWESYTDSTDLDEKRLYVSSLIRKIIIQPNGETTIEWRL